MIDWERHWITPAYIIGAAFDGKQGYFVSREHVAAFWNAHDEAGAVFHNAAFDLDVIRLVAPELDVYAKVDADLVWDTWLLHRLYALAIEGHTAGNEGQATLEACAERYLDINLPKDVIDDSGQLVRTSYGQWLNKPLAKMSAVYLEYLAKDAIATRQVFKRLTKKIDELLGDCRGVWGYVSDEWSHECRERWGPLTHHIQLRAAIVLKEITRNGLHIDLARRDEAVPMLKAQRDEVESHLRDQGVLTKGKGSQKALQTKLQKLAALHPAVNFPRTEKGLFATSAEALHDLVEYVPFVNDLLKYRALDKLLETFLNKLDRGVVHSSFGVLARSGRTSSFGELNAQNLPKDDRIRNCFVPSKGHVFLDHDYSTIELAALAQACVSQFGWKSEMATRINAGDDLHQVFAGFVTRKPQEEVTASERARVKPINFGKPGGMGPRSLQTYAKMTYGIEYTEHEVAELSEQWLDLFPEMREFLKDTVDTPLELARALDLTLVGHHEHTDDDRMLRHPQNAGQGHRPNPILGMMCLRALGSDDPRTVKGKPYTPACVDYFWTKLGHLTEGLPEKFAKAIRERTPSKALQRFVSSHVGRAGVFVLTGRMRAAAGYTARHNTIFQGLTSDGAKIALWKVWRKDYKIANFIHDQILVEVPATDDLKEHAERIKKLMIKGMKEVLPDVRIDVKYAATDRWRKKAEAVFDEQGRLRLWHPKKDRTVSPRSAQRSEKQKSVSVRASG
ncbi:hypothetical protein J8F10_21300 [Gemmata sp. G18]|uniref:DNA-directed DNA polymerase n=1 Tax=Gemmata palustris TaxID=2822762 RepID=A0ABS5BVN9_9BACT|nr:DNA polymerase [Gemmata palustris]MBP3957797.1 hypothetical protein [Gemmata palustris]